MTQAYFCDPCSLICREPAISPGSAFTQRKGFESLGGSRISLVYPDSLVPHKNQRDPLRPMPSHQLRPTPRKCFWYLILTLVSAQPGAVLASMKNLVMYLYLQSKILIFMRNASKSWGQRENYLTPKWLSIFCLRVF